jgi:hypothetical protein
MDMTLNNPCWSTLTPPWKKPQAPALAAAA